MALRLLARREHSVRELRYKLTARGFDDDVIDAVVEHLCDRRLLSDTRFADGYVSSRRQRGFGPLRIEAELRQRGVAPSLVAELLDPTAADWTDSAIHQRNKRFGSQPPAGAREKAKQMRFLEQRGFTAEQIHATFRDEHCCSE